MRIKSVLSILLSFLLFNTSIYANVAKTGQMISTFEMVESFDRAHAENDVKNAIDKAEIKTQLLEYGLSETDISKRLASLSSSELVKLQDNINQAQAGGILQLVLIILLIVFLAQRI